ARARARIAIAGDAPMNDAVRLLARGVARWPEGLRAEPGPWPSPSEHLAAAPSSQHEAVIGWIVEAPNAEVAARAFAGAAASALDTEPGLRVRWHDAGASSGHAWALVALSATPDALDALPAHVARALRSVAHAWPSLAAEASAQEAERRAWARSSPRTTALGLVTEGGPHAPADVRRALERLARSAPYFLVLRPRPGE
ncbi:MAG TPA: hypothetical protein VIL20_08730, partial [Sandaracinaceae bacterium]